ncbi:unnamed protein product, partial [Musa textilis]
FPKPFPQFLTLKRLLFQLRKGEGGIYRSKIDSNLGSKFEIKLEFPVLAVLPPISRQTDSAQAVLPPLLL